MAGTDSDREVLITDAFDPRIDDYRAVRERDLIGPDARPGVFICESRLVVDRALSLGGITKSVLVESRHAHGMRAKMDATGHHDVPLFVASSYVLRSIAGFDVHRGVLAVGLRPSSDRMTIDAVVPRTDRLTVLVVEDVNNADNMGGLYRNAAAFGADAVVLSPRCHDHLYRRCLRVSLGHSLRIPTARSADWMTDLRRLRSDWGLTLIAATPDLDAARLDELPPLARVALVVGSEFSGLSPAASQQADVRVRIPMVSGVDSLNVATAAAICLYHVRTGIIE